MTKEKLINLKEELKKIKEEYEIIPFEEYYEKNKQEEYEIIPFEEYYEKKINYPVKRNFKGMRLKKGIIAAAVAVCVGLASVPTIPMGKNIITVVEAKSKKKKKDNKKPVFKKFGKTKIKVEKGKLVKIPKVSAKDNKDGNVTKKIKLKVVCKKNNKRIKSVEKNILKGKSVRFNTEGLHELTYTVKDKAGNKATKKRYIEVVDPKKKTTEKVTTETPTTEKPTTEEKTTETPTTEKPTTQNPPVEKPTTGIYQEIVNGKTYNIIRDNSGPDLGLIDNESDKININIENDYDRLQLDLNSGLIKNSQYLKFFGNITATDEFGKDISDNIIIIETALNGDSMGILMNSDICRIHIYIEDNYGNSYKKFFELCFRDFEKELPHTFDDPKDLIQLSESPLVYGRPRVEENNLSKSSNAAKTLEYKIEE